MFYIRARKLWTLYPHASLTAAKTWIRRYVDVYVHHTADDGPKGGTKASVEQEIEYLQREERFHVQTRGWVALGYSYVIMPSGRVYEGRGFGIKGAHTLDPKDADHDGVLIENDDIGICFAGNFQTQKPTLRALTAYKLLRARLALKGVRFDRTYPHRACYATSCPGDQVVKALKL